MPKVLMIASTAVHILHFHVPYIRAFTELGWEVEIACAGAEKLTQNATVRSLPFEKSFFSAKNLKAAWMLRKWVKEEKYDLIIVHTSLASFFTRLGLKRMRRPKLINVMHGYLFDDQSSAIKRAVLLGAEKLTAKQTDLLLTMNQWDTVEAEKEKLCRKVLQIPGMGVDFSRLKTAQHMEKGQLRQKYHVPESAVVLIYAAELSGRKSQNVLIRAMKQLPKDVILLLCGTGVLEEEYRTLAKTEGVEDRVRFEGYVKNVGEMYRMADIAVSTSRSEGLPFNIMEAMEMGLPCVCSKVKGHTDLIEDGITGKLVPYGDSYALALALQEMAQRPEERLKMGKEGYERVQRYELSHVMPTVMKAYLSQVK